MQRIDERVTPRLHVVDASRWPLDQLFRQLRADAIQPFDLATGPLIRVILYVRSPEEAILLFAIHHIICDLWSIVTILHEAETLYLAECAGVAARLPVCAPYEAYVRNQTAQMEGPEGQALWDYWRRQLAGPLPALDLPTDYPRRAIQTYRGAAQGCRLDDLLTERIAGLADRQHTTSFAVLLAAFQVLLHHYSRQNLILIGSPRAGRTREYAHTLGYFVNAVVLRADLAGAPSFTRLLNQVSANITDSFAHGSYPFPLLVRRLGLAREPNRSPLFQVMFSWQKTSRALDKNCLTPLLLNIPGPVGELGGLKVDGIPLEQDSSPLDLTLSMLDTGSGLAANLEYNRDLFAASTICGMLEDFQRLLAAIVEEPAHSIEALAAASCGMTFGSEYRWRGAPPLDDAAPAWEQICV